MKALVFTEIEEFELRDVPPPASGSDEVLIKVDSVGICGSDMHAWRGHDERRPPPLILGHEAAGVIADGPEAGLRVIANPLVTCGNCADCRAGRNNLCVSREIISMPPRDGAFAEYFRVPRGNLIAIEDNIESEKAALAEPIACGWHAVRLAGRAMTTSFEEARCIVLGGGAVGLGAALVLAAKGAREIWIGETNPERRKILETAGDFRVFDPVSGTSPDADSADLVVDAVGIDATRAAACASVRRGGVIAHIGLGSPSGGLDIRRMTLQEITFIGNYTYTPEDFNETAKAIFDGSVGTLDWAEVRPLSEGARSFEDIGAGRVAAPKVILKP